MILSSRSSASAPRVVIESDETVDPPMMSVLVDDRVVSMKSATVGFSLFDIATILHELDIGFDYQELK